MFTSSEQHYINNCIRWAEEGNTNFWVVLIAKMFSVIKDLEAEIETTRDKEVEEILDKARIG